MDSSIEQTTDSNTTKTDRFEFPEDAAFIKNFW